MNNYIPDELKDLSKSETRVIQNVIHHIEGEVSRENFLWRQVSITAMVAVIAILLVVSQLNLPKESLNAAQVSLDWERPIFSEQEGLLYIQQVTLGDSKSKVMKQLGEGYVEETPEDGIVADSVFNYNDQARFYFYEGKLDLVVITNVDKTHFDNLFDQYEGVKFVSYESHYIYSKETSHVLKSEFIPEGSLYLSLSYAGPEIMENADFQTAIQKNEGN